LRRISYVEVVLQLFRPFAATPRLPTIVFLQESILLRVSSFDKVSLARPVCTEDVRESQLTSSDEEQESEKSKRLSTCSG
jgi:hypothetical protein